MTATPRDLTCEHLCDPLGLDETAPRLSWRMEDDRPGARQTAWQVKAASRPDLLERKADLWDSGEVAGDRTLDIPWGGKPLASRRQVWWRVRLKDAAGAWSAWSAAASFEMGLLSPADWSGCWIGGSVDGETGSRPSPLLRREFEVREGLVRARAYVTARGLFELHLNGRRVGLDHFAPGWTDYRVRIPYHVYDVHALLQPGANAVGAVLGEGWYAGRIGFQGGRRYYGERPSLLLQIELEYADGSRAVLDSGPGWRAATGPIVSSDIYDGETYDARREMPGWDRAGFDDSAWPEAVACEAPAAALVARRSQPVREHEELPVVEQTEPAFGVHVFDLGQNMVGWARVKVRAPAGQVVRIRYGEMLQEGGLLYTANLRGAACTDRYVCRGGGEEVFEPSFTFHGFRYVEVTGVVEKPRPGDVTGVVLHTAMPRTGDFACSLPLLNSLQRNIEWGLKGNFLEVPTDCPQRDERLGWTGDAQVFIRTAAFNRDVAAFFTKWCVDLADAQYPDGAFPHVVPDVLRDGWFRDTRGCAAWADAGVIIPWTLYLCYADTRILERMYPAMAAWIAWREKRSRDLVCAEACFGDWLAIDLAEGDPGRTPTPRDLIATAYFAHTARIMARVAAVLGKGADRRRYEDLARRVTEAFNREFVTPSGRLAGDTQTAYLLALGFDLLPEERRARAVARLVQDIEDRGWKLSTGFVGTPLLAPVLSACGRGDVAWRLLLQTAYPSWLYTVLQGATTMWERWNSWTKEKGFGEVSMNSFNHYAYGAIGEWLYASAAGLDLDPAEPGYKHIIVRPCPPPLEPGKEPAVTWARAELRTRHGRASSAWRIEQGEFVLEVLVPANTGATVHLPGKPPRKVAAGRHEFRVPFGAPAAAPAADTVASRPPRKPARRAKR